MIKPLFFLRMLAMAAVISVQQTAPLSVAPDYAVGPALDRPEKRRVEEAVGETDGDEVFGCGKSAEFCAYPIRILAYHRVANDQIGRTPAVIAYDPDSGSGEAYDAVVDGIWYQFDTAGTVKGVPLLRDRQTQSLWSQFTGEAVEGTAKGKRLNRLPGAILTWKKWKTLHADTGVLVGDPRQNIRYVHRTTPFNAALPATVQATLPSRLDRRLPLQSLVLGLTTGKKHKAYPYSALNASGGVVADLLDNQAIVVFYDSKARAAAAYSLPTSTHFQTPTPLHQFVSQDRNGERVWRDRTTGSIWNIEGRAIEGELTGKTLSPATFLRSRWYAWSAVFPTTEVYRKQRASPSS